jgi:hypothetical protein
MAKRKKKRTGMNDKVMNWEECGTFDKPIVENSLLRCPICVGRYGIRKWQRLIKDGKMVCPRCRKVFGKETLFVVSYKDRVESDVSTPSSKASAFVGAKAGVGATDKLIKKGVNNE